MKNKQWITTYIRQYRVLLVLSIFLGSLTILFGGALMYTSGYLISKSATQPESILMVYVPIVGVRTFGIGRAALSYAEKLLGHYFTLKILSSMRSRLYKILEPQAFFIRSRFRTGDILGVLADDIEHLQDFYLKTLFPAIISLIIYSVIIFSAGLFSIPFAILLAVMIGLLLFVSPVISLIYVRYKNEQLKHGRSQLYQQFTEAMIGISDWIFSGQYSSFIERYEKNENLLLDIETRKHHFVIYRDFINHVILGLIVIYTIYWANGQTVTGEISPTLIAAFGLVMLSLLESFIPISSAVSETTSYQESLKRLDSIQFPEPVGENQGALSVLAQNNIKITDLSYGYSEKRLFSNFDLTIGQGDKIAILGRSGAGKSTLLKLIQGALVPDEGEVKINGCKAHENESSIAKLLAVLNQKPYLFNTSVLNNIRLGNPEATDEEVFKAAKMVNLDQMIRGLPSGYDTKMQETGQRFSGGERHRIALARILLQKTPIVILDEPAVGLDPITEAQLLKTIFETLKGKTIIWVTHHLIGVENMDRILFLEHGKVVLDGHHEQLLEEEPRYRQLYALDRPIQLSKTLKR
jgi:ATP-binding cassette, subfamily C, bacterial CydC